MKRVFKYSLVTLAVLLLLVSGLLWFVMATETGTGLLWRQARALLPAGVQVAGVAGRLAGPLTVTGIELRNDSVHLRLARAELDWAPGALLGGLLHIERIALTGLRVTGSGADPAPAAGEPLRLPDEIQLPLAVALDELSLRDAVYRPAPAATPIEIDAVALSARADRQRLTVPRLRLRAPLLDVDGHLTVTARGNYPTAGRLDWRLRPPGYAPADAVTRLDGSLQTLRVEQDIGAPYNAQARITAEDLLGELRLDATLTLNDSRLAAIGPELPAATLGGELRVRGAPADLALESELRVTDARFGAVSAALRGRFTDQVAHIETLRIEPAGGDGRLRLAGQVRLGGARPELDLDANWQHLRWPLSGETLVTSPSGRAEFTGTPDDLSAQLNVGLGPQGRITGHARRRGEIIDLALDWQHLAWPLAEPRLRSARGTLQLAGTLDDYDFELTGDLRRPESAPGHVDVAGRGSLRELRLERIDIEALDGTLNGTAEAAWQPGLEVNIDLQARNLNPGLVLGDWPGRLDVDISGEAAQTDGAWRAHIEHFAARGELRGHPLDLDVRGQFADAALMVEELALISGDTRIKASGRVGETLDVDWRIASDDLSQLLPGAAGRLQGSGSASGPLQQPRVAAQLSGRGLAYQDYALDSLALDADIDLGGSGDSRLSLQLDNGHAGGIEIDTLRLDGSGNAAGHRLSLSVRSSRGHADLELSGVFDDPWTAAAVWRGELARGEIGYPQLAPWRLQEAATLRVSGQRLRVDRHCWASQGATLCLAGQRDAGGSTGQFTLEDLDFAYFTALLPERFRIEGAVSGSGSVHAGGDQPLAASVELSTTAGRVGTVAATEDDDAAQPAAAEASMIAFRASELKLDLGADGLQANANLGIREQGGIELRAQVPAGDAAFMRRPLDGRISVKVPELAFIADLVPNLESIEGRLEGDMRLAGSLQAPELKGELRLRDGAAALAGPGLELSQVQLALIGQGGGGVRVRASAHSGGGTLSVEGDADFAARPATADITIQGQDFQVFNTSEAQVFASPDLRLEMGRERIAVTGTLSIPRADITPQRIPASAVTVSADQVIVEADSGSGLEEAEQAAGRDIRTEIRVRLGDQVRVEGFGLKARFTGDLKVVDEPGEPTLGSGEIQIAEGHYQAYGQNLTIENGRILFPGGPITEPGLDVRAVRRPREDILVGVNVRGSLREPEFKLFSEPAMSQREQLSYLVLGRAPERTSGAENSAISQAALAMGLKSADFLAASLGERVGLDEVEIDSRPTSSGTRQAALVLGKYLSPDLYISYGIGLFEPVSTVRLQYAISSKWKFVTESSGNQSSGDIIYTIERGP